MRRSDAGMTLVEIVIAMAVFGAAALFAAHLLGRVNSEGVSTRQRHAQRNDFNLFSGILQKHMASGNSRFFAFTGGTSGSPASRVLSRFLIPQPGRCRDLSTSGCREQSSFLYVHYDKTTTPSLASICQLPGERRSRWNHAKLIIDLGNESFGKAEFDSSSGRFRIGSMTMNLTAGGTMATFDPPQAVLWIATRAPRKLNVSTDPFGRLVFPPSTLVPQECLRNLRRNSSGALITDELYEIEVRPLTLTAFTGGDVVSEDDIAAAWGRFPMRAFAAEIRSVGPAPLPPSGRESGPGFDGGFSRCTVDPDSMELECSSNPILSFAPLDLFRVQVRYNVPLFQGGTPRDAMRWEFVRPGRSPSFGCNTSDCAPLPVPANGGIPALAHSNERFDRLSASRFSLIKQEVISALRFSVVWDRNRADEESFDVRFP